MSLAEAAVPEVRRQAKPLPEPGTYQIRHKKAARALSPRRKALVLARVWEALNLSQAAEKAGLTYEAARLALQDQHVAAFEKEQLEVRRSSERARNLGRMVELRDGSASEKVALEAAKALESPYQQGRGGVTVNVGVAVQAPGYIVHNAYGKAELEAVLRQAGSTEHVLPPDEE